MHLLYLDESGDAYSWQNQKCYVIGGVAIHEGQIDTISAQMDSLQRKYFPEINIPVAFHASDIKRGKGRFEGIALNIRNQMLQDVYTLIENTTFPNLIAFGSTIDISAVENPMQARRDVFEDVCEKFNGFLMNQYRQGRYTKGLLVIDENRAAEYRELINDFKRRGTTHGYLGNIVDIPYFAKCYQTRMLQLADFVTNAIFQYYEFNKGINLNTILSHFYRDPFKGKLSAGFGHKTKKVCNCIVCTRITSTN